MNKNSCRQVIKPAYSLFLIIVFMMLSACSEQDGAHTDSELLLGDGQRWVFINYWATWCKPCIEEIPQLNEFAATHADKVLVYGVNFDGIEGEQLLEQAQKLGIEFILLEKDPGKKIGYTRAQVLPATVVISPDGSIKDTLYGPQTVSSLEQALGLEG